MTIEPLWYKSYFVQSRTIKQFFYTCHVNYLNKVYRRK